MNRTSGTRSVLVFAAILAAMCAGCVNELQRAEGTLSHDHQELAASVEAMLSSWSVEGEWLVSPLLETPDGATRAGVLVGRVVPGHVPVIEARGVSLDGTGPWVPLRETWADEDQIVATAELDQIAEAAQVRVRLADATSFGNLRFAAVVPEAPVDARSSEPEVASRAAELRSELQGLGIVSRASWGARRTRCSSRDASKRRIAVHHTVSSSADPARQMRGIQAFHMDTLNWCDVGYHFLIGADGRVYEGRPLELLGSHTVGENSQNIGISFIGCYHSSGCAGLGPSRPTDEMVRVAGRLMGSLRQIFGLNLTTASVLGHGQHPRQATSCPGANLQPRIREMVDIGRNQTLRSATAPSFAAMEAYWARQSDGRYELRALGPASIVRVEYVVDGFVIGRATRGDGPNFPTTYRFELDRAQRQFEVRGFDAAGRQVGLGVGLLDVTEGTAVSIRQLGASLYVVALERAPAEVAAISLVVDGRFAITDQMSGAARSTRLAVRSTYSQLGERRFAVTTHNADGTARGTLHRTFTLR